MSLARKQAKADIVMTKGSNEWFPGCRPKPKALAEAGGVAASDALKVSRWGPSQIPYPGGDLIGSWSVDRKNEEPLSESRL